MSAFSLLLDRLCFSPDTAGLIGGFFPIEIVNRIWGFLSLNNILSYVTTSGLNHLHVQDFLRRSTNDEIRPFCTDPSALQGVLWQSRSVISGSVALACMIPVSLRDWKPKDMDIYTTTSKAGCILAHLINVEAYMILLESAQSDPTYISIGNIHEIIKLISPTGRCVDLIVTNSKSVLSTVLKFYGTHVANAITGHGLISTYPFRTLNYEVVMNANAGPVQTSPTIAVQKCMVKYTARNFMFAINPIVHLKHPHHCGISYSCPHTHRNLFDGGVLAIASHNTSLPANFVRNDINKVYNGKYGNVWCLGGGTCNLAESLPIVNPCFVDEYKKVRRPEDTIDCSDQMEVS
jgi:hypothetical protein